MGKSIDNYVLMFETRASEFEEEMGKEQSKKFTAEDLKKYENYKNNRTTIFKLMEFKKKEQEEYDKLEEAKKEINAKFEEVKALEENKKKIEKNIDDVLKELNEGKPGDNRKTELYAELEKLGKENKTFEDKIGEKKSELPENKEKQLNEIKQKQQEHKSAMATCDLSCMALLGGRSADDIGLMMENADKRYTDKQQKLKEQKENRKLAEKETAEKEAEEKETAEKETAEKETAEKETAEQETAEQEIENKEKSLIEAPKKENIFKRIANKAKQLFTNIKDKITKKEVKDDAKQEKATMQKEETVEGKETTVEEKEGSKFKENLEPSSRLWNSLSKQDQILMITKYGSKEAYQEVLKAELKAKYEQIRQERAEDAKAVDDVISQYGHGQEAKKMYNENLAKKANEKNDAEGR